MPERVALGIDLGTSAVKVVAVDARGDVVAVARAGYAARSPRPGWAETPPGEWIAAARAAVREALAGAGAPPVAGIGLDGQMHALALVGPDGSPARPAILWPDSRAGAQAARWEALPEPARAALANPVAAGMPGPALRWVMDEEPEAYARARWALGAKDVVRHALAPGLVTDVTDASATLLWDVPGDGWATGVARACGLDVARLPPARPPDACAGVVGEAAASGWGVPAGTPVAVGCGDVAATLHALDGDSERLTLIVGTGAQALRPGVEAVADPAPRFHTYRGVRGHFAMAAVQNAGLALDWARRTLGCGWDELYAAAARPLPGGPDAGFEPVGPVFVPYLSGERLPVPVAGGHGAWRGLGLDTDRPALLRAAAEGVAFAIREAAAALPEAREPTVDLAGGGTRSPELRQLLADVLGRPARRIEVPEVTAVGAALLGWAVAGRPGVRPARRVGAVVEPRPGALRGYDELYARFRAAADAERGQRYG